MRKMSAFLELPGEPAFREVQVILTGKRRAVIENYRNISGKGLSDPLQHLQA